LVVTGLPNLQRDVGGATAFSCAEVALLTDLELALSHHLVLVAVRIADSGSAWTIHDDVGDIVAFVSGRGKACPTPAKPSNAAVLFRNA
jgi:hypothetical protein